MYQIIKYEPHELLPLINKERCYVPRGHGRRYFERNDIEVCYGAFIEGRLVGWSFGARRDSIVGVYVKPKFRRRGIGRKLVQELMDDYRDCYPYFMTFRHTSEAVKKICKDLSRKVSVW